MVRIYAKSAAAVPPIYSGGPCSNRCGTAERYIRFEIFLMARCNVLLVTSE
jgi:hypothetical protein